MAEHRVGARQKPHKLATGRDVFAHLMVEWLQPGDSRVLAARPAKRNLSRPRQRRSPEGKRLSDDNLNKTDSMEQCHCAGAGTTEPRVCSTSGLWPGHPPRSFLCITHLR